MIVARLTEAFLSLLQKLASVIDLKWFGRTSCYETARSKDSVNLHVVKCQVEYSQELPKRLYTSST